MAPRRNGQRRRKEQEAGFRELLPGIPDEITLGLIVPKLAWGEFHKSLSSVSRAWLTAVRSHRIHDARVRLCSTNMLQVVHSWQLGDSNMVSLYLVRDKAFYRIPPILSVKCGIPRSCNSVTIGGKIYILGGLKRPNLTSRLRICSGNVFVLDVAGQKPWQKCANMITPREFCGCIAFQGKIYVFGGTSERMPVASLEVYDPEADTWTEISPMAVWRFCHRVEIMGEELVVSGGMYYTRDFLDPRTSFIQEYISPEGLAVFRDGSEAYNPMTDLWRRLPTDEGSCSFWVEGVLGSFTYQTLDL
ncbi:unnamed protein product [Calypogeia fissa]